MLHISRDVLREVVALPRYTKRAILITVDLIQYFVVLWLMYAVRLGEFYYPPDRGALFVLLSGPITTVAVFSYFGLYRLVTRFIAYDGGLRMTLYALLAGVLWAFAMVALGWPFVPRSILAGYGMVTALVAVLSRQLASHLLADAGINVHRLPLDSREVNVIIYGAGVTGLALARELQHSPMRTTVAFVDPEPTLWGRRVMGLKIYGPDALPQLVRRAKVDEIILALPGAAPEQRSAALGILGKVPAKVLIMPGLGEVEGAEPGAGQIRPLRPHDLLGRSRVPADRALMLRACKGKCILVTGAGGSIGSEIVRQVLRLSPRRIILLDASEAALYLIEQEAREIAGRNAQTRDGAVDIVSTLGSVLDERVVKNVFAAHDIDVVYHAAAYKHVTIVEENALVALGNNTLAVDLVTREAIASRVERFVFISTDKAVLPSSIMGASKRFSEIVLAARSARVEASRPHSILTAVRFGNVLDSSGSVVRKFRRQIENGGPVTVTDPQVTRFFMAVEEAAELVIQAGEMAEGGDVFILEMGEPVKIDDLARLMIHQAGLKIRSPEDPLGDIAIEYVGLRQGEKLHELLSFGESRSKTAHPYIWRVQNRVASPEDVEHALALLRDAIAGNDVTAAMDVMRSTVTDFKLDFVPIVSPRPVLAAADPPSRLPKQVSN